MSTKDELENQVINLQELLATKTVQIQELQTAADTTINTGFNSFPSTPSSSQTDQSTAEIHQYSLNSRNEDYYTIPMVDGKIPKNRETYSVNAVGDNIYLFGGELTTDNDETGKPCNDLYILDIDNIKWKKLKTKNSPEIRHSVRNFLIYILSFCYYKI